MMQIRPKMNQPNQEEEMQIRRFLEHHYPRDPKWVSYFCFNTF